MRSGDAYDLFLCAVKTSKHYNAKRLGTTAVKKQELLDNIGDHLSSEQATAYRALAARANYLSLDRPDISFAAKELCLQFSQPTEQSIKALKRLVRYLVGRPWVLLRFDYMNNTNEATIFVDTDSAGR